MIDNHYFYRKGLYYTLKHLNFVKFAFNASSGKEFIEKQRKTPVDIVIMGVNASVIDEYNTVITLKKEYPATKIVILSMLKDDESIQQFVQAGIHGYLLKNIDNKMLEIALKAVINENYYYSEEVMGFFSRKVQNEFSNQESIKLTKRESEILQLIYKGLTNNEIADKLFISIRTVTNHRFNLNSKTGTRNTVSLIHYCIKNKLLKGQFQNIT